MLYLSECPCHFFNSCKKNDLLNSSKLVYDLLVRADFFFLRAGAPQCSVLYPILFFIFVDNLLSSTSNPIQFIPLRMIAIFVIHFASKSARALCRVRGKGDMNDSFLTRPKNNLRMGSGHSGRFQYWKDPVLSDVSQAGDSFPP